MAITRSGIPRNRHTVFISSEASPYAIAQCWVEPTSATWARKRVMGASIRMTACG